MLVRAEDALRVGRGVGSLGGRKSPLEVTHEVWCFIPPSPKVLGAVAHTRQNGGQVTRAPG